MFWPCGKGPTNASATPTFRNIVYEDIVLRRGGLQMSIQGLPESPVKNVSFRNVSFVDSVGAPPPYNTSGLWGPCENVEGRCDRNTAAGSCPPCFVRDDSHLIP